MLCINLTLCACKGGADRTSSLTDITDIQLSADISKMDFTFSSKDTDASFSADTAEKIDLATATAENGRIVINSAGTYIISGECNNCMLVVDAADTDKVQLVLQNTTIQNTASPAVFLKNADKVFITLADGSQNTFSDGDEYDITEDSSTLDGTIFSKTDLCINGGGTLTVSGNHKHAVVSKDNLIITNGTLNITAKKVGLSGKDCVKFGGGNINITAGSDGIRSDNDTDSARGFVYITDTTLNITAENDGIQAETVIKAESGNISLKTGGGSDNASASAKNEWNGSWKFSKGNKTTDNTTTDDTPSAKGLKAECDIIINGGSFVIDSADDAVHSNGTVMVENGVFSIKSGNDGIHADDTLSISGGTVEINKSYEGLEAKKLYLSGGKTTVYATDDGLNAAGGNDSSSLGRRPGQNAFGDNGGKLIISGGYHFISADGDGIDSNGTMEISGGITLVSGPTSGADGALDYENGCTVKGGTLIALGSSQMASGFTSAENQGGIFLSFNSQPAETAFTVCDADGNALVSFTPKKEYSSAAVTSPKITKGNTYKIVSGGTVENADENGYAADFSVSDYTLISEVILSSSLYSSDTRGNGHSFGSEKREPDKNGDMQMPDGKPPQDMKKPDNIPERP